MKIFNASLDKFQIQCNSLVFQFNPRSYGVMGKDNKNIPDELVPFIVNQFKDRGVFAVSPSMSKDELKEAHRTALLSYLGGCLKERVTNYTSQEDEFRKKGVTFRRHPRFEEALRWEQEIRELLEMERPIEEELSFLDVERRKKLGFDKASIQEFKGDDLFADFENVQVVQPGEEEPKSKIRRSKSFKEIDVAELG